MLFFACHRLRVGISRLFFRSRIFFCSLLNWLIFIGTELHTLFSVRSARVGSLFYCRLLKVYTRVSVCMRVLIFLEWVTLAEKCSSRLTRRTAKWTWVVCLLERSEFLLCLIFQSEGGIDLQLSVIAFKLLLACCWYRAVIFFRQLCNPGFLFSIVGVIQK